MGSIKFYIHVVGTVLCVYALLPGRSVQSNTISNVLDGNN